MTELERVVAFTWGAALAHQVEEVPVNLETLTTIVRRCAAAEAERCHNGEQAAGFAYALTEIVIRRQREAGATPASAH